MLFKRTSSRDSLWKSLRDYLRNPLKKLRIISGRNRVRDSPRIFVRNRQSHTLGNVLNSSLGNALIVLFKDSFEGFSKELLEGLFKESS